MYVHNKALYVFVERDMIIYTEIPTIQTMKQTCVHTYVHVHVVLCRHKSMRLKSSPSMCTSWHKHWYVKTDQGKMCISQSSNMYCTYKDILSVYCTVHYVDVKCVCVYTCTCTHTQTLSCRYYCWKYKGISIILLWWHMCINQQKCI